MSNPRLPPIETAAAPALRAAILLAGRVGRNSFADRLNRSVLDLPIFEGRTLMDRWVEHFDALAHALDLPAVRVRLAVDRNGTGPRFRAHPGTERVSIEVVPDAEEYRGTAGVVRDVTRDFGEDDLVLVAAANQVLCDPLHEVVEAMGPRCEGVSVAPYAGGEFAAAFLLRCGRFRGVPDVGFVDLKEQAIPSVLGRNRVFVTRLAAGATHPVRTLGEYVHMLRAVHSSERRTEGTRPQPDPYAEAWRPAFALVERGAYVEPGAVLHDAVVLAGGRVEAGAVVARSVVAASALVRRGRRVVDTVVAA